MASILKRDVENKFPNPRLAKSLFLSSVRDFKPDGVKLGVERVSKLFQVKQDPEKAQMTVELCVLDNMEKCRMYELDENEDYILEKDEISGKEMKKVTIESISAEDVLLFPMFFPCGKPKEISPDAELIFYPTSSSYPLFKFALQNSGELPEDMGNEAFATTHEELKDALEGLVFLAKCEEIRGKYNYMRLKVEEAEL